AMREAASALPADQPGVAPRSIAARSKSGPTRSSSATSSSHVCCFFAMQHTLGSALRERGDADGDRVAGVADDGADVEQLVEAEPPRAGVGSLEPVHERAERVAEPAGDDEPDDGR